MPTARKSPSTWPRITARSPDELHAKAGARPCMPDCAVSCRRIRVGRRNAACVRTVTHNVSFGTRQARLVRLPNPLFWKRLLNAAAVWPRSVAECCRRHRCTTQQPTRGDGSTMGRLIASGLWTLLFVTGSALADISVMVGVDPSDRESMIISLLDMQQTLSKRSEERRV